MRTAPRRQSGATLLVTLIMLIMLTLFAISAMNTSTDNLKMVGNMQERSEAFEAAQATIELAISTSDFATTPANAVPNPCGIPNTTCTDLNGDGIHDLQTQLTPNPQCVQARAIKVNELQINGPQAQDVACIKDQAQGTFAVAGAATSGDSLCAHTVWDIAAVSTRAGTSLTSTDVKVGVTQGVGIRIPALEMEYNCPI